MYEENPVTSVPDKTFDNRDLGIEKLENVDIGIVTRPAPGSDGYKRWGGDPYLTFSSPVAVRHGGHELKVIGASFFTKTDKMTAASFGIPAGPKSVGGTCPSAALPDSYVKHLSLGEVDDQPMRYDEQICRKCYANKGNFMYELQQLYQTARFHWLDDQFSSGLKPDQVAAIVTEALATHLGNVKKRKADGEDPRFFRIHDSGDLYTMDIWRMWRKVCLNLPDVKFWCPTRQWLIPEYTKLFQREGVPENLALRPSAYHFDDIAPVIDGLAAGSTAHYWEDRKKDPRRTDPLGEADLADWVCPAYEEGGKSCGGALDRASRSRTGRDLESLQGVLGKMTPEERELTNNGHDCRVCWLKKDMRVSYKAH